MLVDMATTCNDLKDLLVVGNKMASSILNMNLGPTSAEDLFSTWYLKMKKKGLSDEAIVAYSKPTSRLWRSLVNLRNDVYRKETQVMGDERSFREVDIEEDELADANSNPETQTILEQERIEVRQRAHHLFRVAGLSETQIQIVEMDMEAFSTAEIAELLGTTRNSVYSRRTEAYSLISEVLKVNKTIFPYGDQGDA